jgi:NADH-quinone oxidoreductase subunit L
VGVLAISGAPFLSGWYSKDQILSAAMGYGLEHRQHIVLFLLPTITAGLTAYYMFRLWFLTFAGKPRDTDVHEHAHESPTVMTAPLIILAVFSLGVAWGWPLWDADASYLGHILEKAEPGFVATQFAVEREEAHHRHLTAGALALLLAVSGAGLAWWLFGKQQPADVDLYRPGGPLYRFLLGKWYFDEAYDATLVNPTVTLAKAAAAVDKAPTEPETAPKGLPVPTLDGLLNAVGGLFVVIGEMLRGVQTGRLRSYVLALGLTAVVLLGILTTLAK